MGSSATATLAYGYVQENVRRPDGTIDWDRDDANTLEWDNFSEVVNEDYTKQYDLEKSIGVKFSGFGAEQDWRRYLAVAATLQSVDWGDVLEPDLSLFQSDTTEWDAKLAQFADEFGFSPEFRNPKWFLVASYG
jgi:hypothetical protein